MVKQREVYDLTGYDAALAFSKLEKIFGFKKPRTLKLRRGLCAQTAYCYHGANDSLDRIRVAYSQMGNKARIYVFHDENARPNDIDLVRSLILRPNRAEPESVKNPKAQIDWRYLHT